MRLINKKGIRDYALLYAAEKRPFPGQRGPRFVRVSPGFIEDCEIALKAFIKKSIEQLPSKGRTIRVLAVLALVAAPVQAQDVVSCAVSHIGRGETRADNTGPWVKRYLRTSKPLPWCAGFVSHVLREAGKQVPYTLSARAFLELGSRVREPRPGDIAVFWRGKRRGRLGHAAVVESVRDGSVCIIEGNRGGYPAAVRRRCYVRADEAREQLLGYVRI